MYRVHSDTGVNCQNIDKTSQSLYDYDWPGSCINLVVHVGMRIASIDDASYPL